MHDHHSSAVSTKMLTKFELRLQLDSASIAAVSGAIQGSMGRIADSITAALDKIKRSLHDLSWAHQAALRQNSELHKLLVNRLVLEIEKASRMPQQPSEPPPPELLAVGRKQPPQQAGSSPPPPGPPGPPGPLPANTPRASRTRTPPPAKAEPKTQPQKLLVPKHQVPLKACPGIATKKPKTEDFHLHHFLVVIQQTCSLH